MDGYKGLIGRVEGGNLIGLYTSIYIAHCTPTFLLGFYYMPLALVVAMLVAMKYTFLLGLC